MSPGHISSFNMYLKCYQRQKKSSLYSMERVSCTTDKNILLKYPCYLIQTVTRGLLIGYIGTRAHGRQVTSVFNQSDVIM